MYRGGKHISRKEGSKLLEIMNHIHNVSVNSNWVHPPGNPRGLAQKHCPGVGI